MNGSWRVPAVRGGCWGALYCWHPLLCCSTLPCTCPFPFPFPFPCPLPSPPHAPHPQIQAANPVARALFNTAYRYKQAAMQRGDLSGGRLAPLWDRLVFSKVRARVGGGCLLRPAGCLLVACLVGGEGLYCLIPACLLNSPTPMPGCRRGAAAEQRGVTHLSRGI